MKIDGLSVETEGDSKSKLAILLPGLLDSKNYPHFIKFSELLVEQGFLVVRFDPRGTGESDGSIEEYTRANILEDISKLIDHFGKEAKEVVLIGHSFGAANAILAAAKDKRVTKVFATAPPYSMRRIDNEERNKEWEQKGFRESDRQNDDGSTHHYKLPYSFLTEAEKHNVTTEITKTTAPILLIACKHDDTVDPEGVKELGKELPNVTVRELNIGHDYWQPGNEKELELVIDEMLNFVKPKFQIVNENDEVVGVKTKAEIDQNNDTYRVSALWLRNSQGEVLIAQRKLDKKHDPGKWGPAVAGTVEEGETYESNIYKEAKEEIGLTGLKFSVGPKARIREPHSYFGQWFLANVDWPAEKFRPQPEEVEQLAWVNRDKLLEDVKNNPQKYISTMPSILELLEGEK